MATTVQIPVEGRPAVYSGVYRPHWEICHIAVRIPRDWSIVRRLLFPTFVVLGAIASYLAGFLTLTDVGVGIALLAGLSLIAVLMPNEERWAPHFSPNSGGELDDLGGPIEFEGIVSPRGKHGHKGCMCRKVEIIRVLRYRNRRQRANSPSD
jgi:hypothetical protein